MNLQSQKETPANSTNFWMTASIFFTSELIETKAFECDENNESNNFKTVFC